MFKHSPEFLSVSLLEAAVSVSSFTPSVVEIAPAPAAAARSSSHRSMKVPASNSVASSDDDDNTVATALLEELDELRQQLNDFQKQTDADRLRIQQLSAEVWCILFYLVLLQGICT